VPIPLRYIAAISLALALSACLANRAGTARAALTACERPPAARFTMSVEADGVERTALVNVPPAAPVGRPLPLVLMFHGQSSNGPATEAVTGFSSLGERNGFIAVYPNSRGPRWQVTTHSEHPQRDVEFVRVLLDRLEAELCIDRSRVFAAGGSNGASFVARLGCELSDRLAAIAAVAGAYWAQPACAPAHPLSVLEIHGTSDTTTLYGGVWGFLGRWVALDRCPPGPLQWRRLSRQVLWAARSDCAEGTTVAAIKLRGAPHAWPSRTRDAHGHLVGTVPFSARSAIWQFFATGSAEPQPY
jgi:polyhydroxybutyrate depolymerase